MDFVFYSKHQNTKLFHSIRCIIIGGGSRTGNQAFFIVPFGENSFVQIHENGVHRTKLTVKNAFHVSVRAQRIFDVAHLTATRSQFNRSEIVDVFFVKEHVPNGGRSSINLTGGKMYMVLKEYLLASLFGHVPLTDVR